jgi:hypothetical protein
MQPLRFPMKRNWQCRSLRGAVKIICAERNYSDWGLKLRRGRSYTTGSLACVHAATDHRYFGTLAGAVLEEC